MDRAGIAVAIALTKKAAVLVGRDCDVERIKQARIAFFEVG
jgi:hypothetical protein